MDTVVMKFGGTSVQDAAAIARLARAVAAEPCRSVVVVSALAGVTDALCALADGMHSEAEAAELTKPLCDRHVAIARELVTPSSQQRLVDRIRLRFQSAACAASMPRDLRSARDRDALLATGELASSEVAAAALVSAGLPASWVDARQVIVTDGTFGHARPDEASIQETAGRWLGPLLAEGRIPVLGGFIGATVAGVTTTLGRGGSDYSASLVGAALGARQVQIWTDVDGVFSADPRLVATPILIPRLSFREAYELARFGAKVLHWGTLEPAASHDIPVRVLNARKVDGSVSLDHAGTTIAAEPRSPTPSIAGLAQRAAVTVADIRPRGVTGSTLFLQASVEWLDQYGHGLTVISLSPARLVVACEDEALAGRLVSVLEPVARATLTHGALVTLVGNQIVNHAEAWAAVTRWLNAGQLSLAVPAQSGDALVCVTTRDACAWLFSEMHDLFFGGAEALPRGSRRLDPSRRSGDNSADVQPAHGA